MARSFQRPVRQRQIGRRVIIACEGISTEPGYFEEIRKSKNLSKKQIILVSHVGTDPLTVVKAAIEEQNAQKQRRDWGKDDRAWAVFDGDEHRQENPENWNDALQKAAGQNIRLAISNPCFEFWYLLHFQEHSAHLTRQKARELLRRHLSAYEKANRLYPVPLEPLTADALQRAKFLAGRAASDKLLPYTNPSTGVGDLVELLLGLESQVA